MAADEAGSASDENAHGRALYRRRRRPQKAPQKTSAGEDTPADGNHPYRRSRVFGKKNLSLKRWEVMSAASGFPMMLVGPAHHDRVSFPGLN
jgi:hypothetical protein